MIVFETLAGAPYALPAVIAPPDGGRVVLPELLRVRNTGAVTLSASLSASPAGAVLFRRVVTDLMAPIDSPATVITLGYDASSGDTVGNIWLRFSDRGVPRWVRLDAISTSAETDGELYIQGTLPNLGLPVDVFVEYTPNGGSAQLVPLNSELRNPYPRISFGIPLGTPAAEATDVFGADFASTLALSLAPGAAAFVELAVPAVTRSRRVAVLDGVTQLWLTLARPAASAGSRETYTWAPNVSTLSSARSALCSAVLDGFAYFMGGQASSNANSVDRVNLATWVRETCAKLRDKRSNAAATAHSGKLYVFGGYRPSPYAMQNTVDIYDPVANSWTAGPAIPTVWGQGHAVAVGDYIWLFGGVTTAVFTGLYRLHVPTLTWTTFATGGIAAQSTSSKSSAQDGAKFYFIASNNNLCVIDFSTPTPTITQGPAVLGGNISTALARLGQRKLVLHTNASSAGYWPRVFDMDDLNAAPVEFAAAELSGLTRTALPTSVSYETSAGVYAALFAGGSGNGATGSTVINRVRADYLFGSTVDMDAEELQWNNKAYDMAMMTQVRSVTAPTGMVVALPLRDTAGVVNIDVDYLAALLSMRPQYQDSARLGTELPVRKFEIAVCTSLTLYRSGAYGVYIASHLPNSVALRAQSAGAVAELSTDGDHYYPSSITAHSQDELSVKLRASSRLSGEGAESVVIYAKIGG